MKAAILYKELNHEELEQNQEVCHFLEDSH